ncbi:MAG: hypothetical protein CVU54_03405 [Deltaproteobacteria bacterium HGW-Deltaproteobacteria-12]|nr:MAG: hypothetical protein CVU54_03405 [Deltaproteobacteria bacterium HGW-Deltaproteobacteria-12]
MPRPKCCRHVGCMPDKNYFKPRGIPASELEEVVLSLDEYEAIRLADYEQLYQEKAAAQMNISRQTFGRIIESAHKKVAAVLLFGKALKIEGGEVSVGKKKQTECPECNKALNLRSGSSPEEICPYCRKRR